MVADVPGSGGPGDGDGPAASPGGAAWGVRLGALLLGILLAASLALLAPGPEPLVPAALGLALVGLVLVPPRAWGYLPRLEAPPAGWIVLGGASLLAIASVGIPLARYASLRGLLFLVAAGVPFLLLVVIVGRLDPDASPRPRLPLESLARRLGPRLVLVLLLVLAPALFAPVRFLWETDLAATSGVLTLAGATVAVFVPLLVDRDREPRSLEAQPLDPDRGTTVFEVLRRRTRRR